MYRAQSRTYKDTYLTYISREVDHKKLECEKTIHVSECLVTAVNLPLSVTDFVVNFPEPSCVSYSKGRCFGGISI